MLDTSEVRNPSKPLSMVRELPPGPADQCTTEELTSFVANISLFTRGKGHQEQKMLRARMLEASEVLKARGIPFVAMAHWNFGHAERKPDGLPNNALHDLDWYKKPPPRRGLLAWLRGLFR